MVLNSFTEPIRKKSNRGYENRSRTKPWKSWTVPALECNMRGSYLVAPDLEITCNGIIKLLKRLNPHKAAGPDGIKPRVLKELAESVAPILTIIFRKSLSSGGEHMLVRSTRKETGIWQKITVPFRLRAYVVNWWSMWLPATSCSMRTEITSYIRYNMAFAPIDLARHSSSSL